MEFVNVMNPHVFVIRQNATNSCTEDLSQLQLPLAVKEDDGRVQMSYSRPNV